MSKHYNENLELINLAKLLIYQTDFNEVLRLVAQKASQFLDADLALILMVNPDTRDTIKTVVKDGRYYERDYYRAIHTNIGGWIIHYKRPFFSEDIHKDKRFSEGLFDNLAIKSVAGVPLIVEGVIIGILILVFQDTKNEINSTVIRFLEDMAIVSAPFLRNVQKIRQFFDSALPKSTLISKYGSMGLKGKSKRFIELLQSVEAATKCDVRVLLDGQTGTGKELIAKSIHQFSLRTEFPFVAIDCGAIPYNLLESELFGHKRGAFTSANSDRQGLFVKANKGTLFMDEINNLSLEMQSKLLRVLQEGEVRPLGSNESIKIDVRVIAASSVSLRTLVDEQKFREDLFYRLHVYPIYIPDLSERKEDIPLLANHFLRQKAIKQNKQINNLHEEIVEFIKQRHWHGNIRELENFIERLVTIAPHYMTTIDPNIFPLDLQKEFDSLRSNLSLSGKTESLKEKMDKYETVLIEKTLNECNWNQSEAARILKISEGTIRYKINHLNIKKD